MAENYYKILGVNQGASSEEIKKAYRQLAMRYHPDRNPNDKVAEQKFKEISQAYETLKDPQKKAAYDQYGTTDFHSGGRGGESPFSGFGSSFSDIFDEMFGNFSGQSSQSTFHQPGSDVRFDLDLSLEEAFLGKETTIRYKTGGTCEPCSGYGTKSKSPPSNCSTCKGYGKVRFQQGFFTVEKTCHVCHGQGKILPDPCSTCRGLGRIIKEKILSVKIPAGVEDGTRMRVPKEGEVGVRRAPPGDLYVFITVRPHKIFSRRGSDLLCKIPIPMAMAALGGDIEVPTLEGKSVELKIPQGTQNGKQFRLRGKGMPLLKSTSRGSMIVEALVETPVNLSKKQKDLLRQFSEISKEESNNPQSTSFFTKVKDFFSDLSKNVGG